MSHKDMASSSRALNALALRKEGRQWDDVARIAGYADKGSACNAVSRLLRSEKRGDVEELRELQAQRLDDAMLAVRRCALGSTEVDSETGATIITKPDLWALDRYLRIIELQNKLFGLNRDSDDDNHMYPQVLIREIAAPLDNL